MDELNDCCEVLLEQCAFIEIREQCNQVQEHYSKLAASIHGELNMHSVEYNIVENYPYP